MTNDELFNWVGLARGGDKEYPGLSYIYVKDGMAVATDRHRLHMAAIPIGDGMYNPYGMKTATKHKYPDYTKQFLTKGDFYEWKRPAGTCVQINHTWCYQLIKSVAFNCRYIDDVLDGDDGFTYQFDTPSRPIVIAKEDGRVAVVMPIISKGQQ